MIGSPRYPVDEQRMREQAAETYDRCHHPAGTARQLAAILASGSRTAALRQLDVPTVVIHGKDDPLVPFRAGVATAQGDPGRRARGDPGDGARPAARAVAAVHGRAGGERGACGGGTRLGAVLGASSRASASVASSSSPWTSS